MNKNLGGLRGQKFPKTRNVAQMIEGRLQTEFTWVKNRRGTVRNKSNIYGGLRLAELCLFRNEVVVETTAGCT